MLISLTTVLQRVLLADTNNLSSKEVLKLNKETPFTHYQVCEYNRLRIREKHIEHHEDLILFRISRQINEYEWDSHEFYIPRMSQQGQISMRVNAAAVIIRFDNGAEMGFPDVFTFLMQMGLWFGRNDQLNGLLDLDVMYIGQTTIGDNGYLRFHNHEKILKFSGDIIKKRPEKEVVIKLMSFGSPNVISQLIPEIDSDDSRADWMNGELANSFPQDQWKTIIEAALINYFNTDVYNKNYVNHFPLPSHCYKYFYERNIASICVELQEEYMAYRTLKKGKDPKRVRLIRYALDPEYKEPLDINNDNQISDDLYEKITGYSSVNP